MSFFKELVKLSEKNKNLEKKFIKYFVYGCFNSIIHKKFVFFIYYTKIIRTFMQSITFFQITY